MEEASSSSTTTVMTSTNEPVGTTTNGSVGPLLVQETSVRMIESVKNRVVSNKTIIQRTTDTNAIQVNKYDAEGNLKSSDIETTSWEDRDTQSYQWSNQEEPPPQALAPPPTDERIEQFFASADQQQQKQHHQGTDGEQAAVVLTTAERRDVPAAVSWSGSTANHQVDDTSGEEQHTTTKLGGSQWSRSGESVWISSCPALPASPSQTHSIDGPAKEPAADTPTAGRLSVEERRLRRCAENRSRKAAVAGNSTPATTRIRPSPTSQ